MTEQSWERQAVDEIIAAEKRISELVVVLERKESLWQIATALGLSPLAIEQLIEEIESELSDLQKVIGNDNS